MTETLTGKQVLALLAQDEPPEIEAMNMAGEWVRLIVTQWDIVMLRSTKILFRIKPTPARRLSVTLSNGEVVSWPEPVREALEYGATYWLVFCNGDVDSLIWDGGSMDRDYLAFGTCHLTREAAQEHADALRRINTQEVGKC